MMENYDEEHSTYKYIEYGLEGHISVVVFRDLYTVTCYSDLGLPN